jgi:site-specific recombinase XerD
VTHQRQIMLEELRRRNYAESTIHAYSHTVEHFSRHFHRSPDQLGPEHIRQYQAALFTRWKLAPNTVTQRLATLRFFYVQVLKRGSSFAETPYPKKVLHLPQVLSPKRSRMSARWIAYLLARASAEAPRLAVSRQSMAYGESSCLHQGSLERLSAGRRTRRP